MRSRGLVSIAILPILLVSPGEALAHGTQEIGVGLPSPADIAIGAGIGLAAFGYAVGAARLWQRSRNGRQDLSVRVVLFAGGLVVIAFALLSPLAELGEGLFTAHMIEHELIMALAAPLVAFSRPLSVFIWIVPEGLRPIVGQSGRHLVGGLTKPIAASLLHGAAIWFWHLPAAFGAALRDPVFHILQHLSFGGSALLFWGVLFGLPRHRYGTGALHLLVTTTHMSVLAALFVFSEKAFYVQSAHASEWGLTPLEDQQLAGLVMWVPAGLVYLVAALWFFSRWISRAPAEPAFMRP
jgi:putative membrane protein